MASKERIELLDALASAIRSAPEAQRNRLAQALETYFETFPTSYKSMASGNTLAAALIYTMEEQSDARVGHPL